MSATLLGQAVVYLAAALVCVPLAKRFGLGSVLGYLLAGILIGLISYFLAPLIVYVKPGMDLAISSLRILVVALPLFYLTAPLMWQLIVARRDRVVLSTYLAAALLNLGGNLLVVPRFGAPAAALTTGLTELIIFLLLLYHSRNA